MRAHWLLWAFLMPGLSSAASLLIPPTDVGEVRQFSSAESQIAVTNPGPETVSILDVSPLRKADSVSSFPKSIPPGATLIIAVSVGAQNDLGVHLHGFRIRTDEKKGGEYFAQVKLFGTSVLDEPRPVVDFGPVDAGTPVEPRTVRFTSREVPRLEMAKILEAPEFVDASLTEDRRGIVLAVRDRADWGPQDGFVRIGLDSEQQSEAWVEVRAEIRGDVVPDSNPFGFGVARVGEKSAYKLRLTSRSGQDFRIGKITLEGFKGKASTTSCVPKLPGCRMLVLHVAGDQPTGKLSGVVSLELPDLHNRLPIHVWGVLLKPSTKVISLDDALKADQPARAGEGAGGQSSAGTPKLADALKRATKTTGISPEPDGRGPLLRWKVANEQAIFGYIIYRAASVDGPFLRVNEKTIPVVGEGGGATSYSWRDTSAVPGTTYWYQIGMLFFDGHKQDLTGPQEVLAK